MRACTGALLVIKFIVCGTLMYNIVVNVFRQTDSESVAALESV